MTDKAPDTTETTADAKADAKVAKDNDGNAVLDFADYASAAAQAKAIGKGATVEHIGTAFHVATGK